MLTVIKLVPDSRGIPTHRPTYKCLRIKRRSWKHYHEGTG